MAINWRWQSGGQSALQVVKLQVIFRPVVLIYQAWLLRPALCRRVRRSRPEAAPMLLARPQGHGIFHPRRGLVGAIFGARTDRGVGTLGKE